MPTHTNSGRAAVGLGGAPASVATVGMLPAALATGVGSDVQRSLATVVAGGLVPATLLTLFIIPTFYYAIEGRVARRLSAATPAPNEA
jgi:heavy metal efflux system protein